ncbi:MAG: hypothetical protein QW291_05610 [Thermofilaceae archaeon]
MKLLYKEDWEEAKNLLTAWWEGETRKPVIQVTAPKDPAKWYSYDGWDFCRYLDDPIVVVKRFEEFCSATFFGGAAYPNLWINFGAGVLSAFLGVQPVFQSHTMWFGNQQSRGTVSLKEIAESKLDKENIWWRRVYLATKTAVEMHLGRFIVGMTDIGGVLDVIAALRGTVELLKDVYRNPDALLNTICNVTELWHECYNSLYTVMCEGKHEGTSAWMGIWCPQRWYPLQCDVSYMLSPATFEKFVKPHLEEQCLKLDYSAYHLDGPEQIKHLNALLKIQELHAIQWVPGAKEDLSGNDCGSSKWFGLYKRILESGKGLIIAVPPAHVRNILEVFPEGRIIIQTWALNEKEARTLLNL